ncbi:CHASE2 domain-containing protein [Sulfitobacter sp. SK011]|uniref:CHASE2 domain-containing protein n=1 Tax=Sulfitobacter sp. SK011 TaxID=1389004 RepID=UPI0020C78E61|nr:adenylate/guanylate cyclase domain-containing protein [Sulfitobacter sp. SK011]
MPHINGRAGIIEGLENRSIDLRFTLVGPRSASSDVVIVAIDDDTLAAEANRTMSGRSLLGALIRNIGESGARALAVDVLLVEPSDADEDAALANSLASTPSAIAAAALFGPDGKDPASLIWPQPIFQDVAGVGLVNLSTDASGTPRYMPLLINIGGEHHQSLALRTALAFTGERAVFGETQLTLGDRHIPLDQGFNMPLRFSGPEGSVQTVSAKGVLAAPMPNALSGKAVVLGYSASAMGDRFSTPFDNSTPGVEIIATAISQLTGGPTLRRDKQVRIWDAAHGLGLTLLCIIAIVVWPLSRSLPIALAMIGLSMIALTAVFSAGVWMSAALPLMTTIPPVLVVGAMRYTQERQQADRSERAVASLRQFQSPALATKIEADAEYLTTPIEQLLIILFVDLTGFTGLSQKLGEGGTRNLLRTFHLFASDTIEKRGGSVLNYMGDGALAVFGLEMDASTHAADDALAAAFELARSLSQHEIEELPDVFLGCRIGLHAGIATLSRMGVESHQQVTVTGDSVNLASRLMEVAKTEKAVIVASADFVEALSGSAHNDKARQTEVSIRGRDGLVRVLAWTQDVIT